MIKTDLHIHTTASDGSWSPIQLMEAVRKAEIQLFSITDHDSVDNVPEVTGLAKEYGVAFLPGVEICSTHLGKQFHILGYGIDCQSPVLQKLLQHNMRLMEEADRRCIRQLISQGMKTVDYEEYLAYRHKPERGGWKSLNYLVDKGLCHGVGDFFGRLFTPEKGIRFPEFPRPDEVISAIHAACGVAVLAHPGSEFHGAVLEETLEYFLSEAIDGVECFHPGHDRETTATAKAWCRKRGLLVTGGSDCHGSFVPGRRLGQPEIDLAELNLGSLLQKGLLSFG